MAKVQNEKLTTNCLLIWLNRHTSIGYIVIFLAYLLLASIFNWSLLLGENLMKWDIWIAEYPNQILMSDAIKNGEIMLWNPLMQYGTPTYAIVGTPIWYPITLFLALLGYNPIVLAFSYVIHIAIGGFGMFLLGQQELRERSGQWTLESLMASIAAGLLYCNSGVFLSNAQHIMIIISAAWIPYVFYFIREYLEKKQMIYAMLAGVSAGMIFMGGYPELFYDTFLFLVPYTLYFSYKSQKSFIKNILWAFRSYALVGVCTVLCCAVSLIPFLNIMGDLTRTSGLGQIPHNPGVIALMSLLFPRTAAFALSADSSMINFYVGIITVLLLPVILKSKNRNKLLYLGMGGVALFVCLGSDFFLYEILFRFFPMYSSFRFPSVDRCIFAIFLLLNVTNAFYEITSKHVVEASYRLTKNIFLTVLLFAVISGLIAYMGNDAFQLDKTIVSAFSNSAWFTAVVVGAYFALFYVGSIQLVNTKVFIVGMMGTLLLDVAVFHHEEFPSTIASYNHSEYSYNSVVQDTIQNEFKRYAERNTIVDFVDSVRGSHNMDSQAIVFNKVLDEDGYVSILLQNVQSFKNTYRRSIMEQNPVVYFTNDIMTQDDIAYDVWVNSAGTAPEQIYVDGEHVTADSKIRFEQEIIYNEELPIVFNDGVVSIERMISAGDTQTSRVRLFYSDEQTDCKNLVVTYYDSNGNGQQYEGEYETKVTDGGYYVDVYFPNIDTVYTKIDLASADNIAPVSAALVDTGRLKKDRYVEMNTFGFRDISMTVNAPTEGYVTILQTYYDGWKAYADGVEVPISTVNDCFMGIKVSEGVHEIVLEFRPVDFYIGLTISGLFCIAVCIVLVRYLLIRRKEISSD